MRRDPEVPKREIKMGKIKENWQPAKFYCSEIKLIYSRRPVLKGERAGEVRETLPSSYQHV